MKKFRLAAIALLSTASWALTSLAWADLDPVLHIERSKIRPAPWKNYQPGSAHENELRKTEFGSQWAEFVTNLDRAKTNTWERIRRFQTPFIQEHETGFKREYVILKEIERDSGRLAQDVLLLPKLRFNGTVDYETYGGFRTGGISKDGVRQPLVFNINFIKGRKKLRAKDWEPTEDQEEFGVQLDLGTKNRPLRFALDYFYAESAEEKLLLYFIGIVPIYLNVKSRTQEINPGMRLVFPNGVGSTHIGGGLSFMRAEIDSNASREPEIGTGTGIWLDAGIYFTLFDRLNLGFNAKYSYGKVSLLDEEVNAGGRSLGLTAGFHF